MVWQLSNGIRDVSPEQAVSLEIASDGAIDAAKACPDFFERLKKIGFERKQGESNGMETQPHGTEARTAGSGDTVEIAALEGGVATQGRPSQPIEH